MTHDSIGLGEDGPTHQPVEHLASLRAIPNLIVIRPCDIIETIEAWEYVLKEKKSPAVLVLTRQNVSLLRKHYTKRNLLEKGAYIITNFINYDATILATGSEVEIAAQTSKNLKKEKIYVRVVSFPSWELFSKQSIAYQKNIIGKKPCFAIEAGIINGWERYVPKENFLGMKTFGKSGPYKKLYKHFNLNDNNLSKLIKKRL